MSAWILIAEECLPVWDLGQIIINIDFIACVSKIFRYDNCTVTVGCLHLEDGDISFFQESNHYIIGSLKFKVYN